MSDVSEPNESVPDQLDGPEPDSPAQQRPDEPAPGSAEGERVAGPAHQLFRLADRREEAIEAAQRAVRAGRCIVLPTDTVYGIGADAFSAPAVQRLLDAKRRGRDMPPPVLIAEPAMLPALVAYVPLSARAMVEKFWPGALTLIFRAQASLRLDLGDTGGTIAVRVPDNDAARALLRHTGPLAVSSANISGSPSATNVADAEAMLGDSVDVYLDGGPTPGPVASTIVDFTQNPSGKILRQGVVSFEALRELSAGLENLPEPAANAQEPAAGQAAGLEEAVPESAAPAQAVGRSEPDGPRPAEGVPDGPNSDESGPDVPQPDEGEPVEAAPDDTKPAESEPAGSAPGAGDPPPDRGHAAPTI
ncbi:tRNA threonylcarbamoyl adenosine modification protein, Sua5/YciO/YrdC/YwlC family [Propionibacterium cyclohexanicum]|uniref:L-threonylcarbamoyladenylate synthase n=1 Tax=Propionibacterium cyclohexanicum TaxID=64702 RepID=A0A1H9QZS9_9ACTN|nr:L-threonylcarbamoyladenylate synthase [Propionibacterium cyclohexanicum]SER65976.1 tRNA threonylcarbamoyl adenosine modification protein, Sua5/YciO/YrdC/YwlC family [Propionibacterium cyclohexanicum]